MIALRRRQRSLSWCSGPQAAEPKQNHSDGPDLAHGLHQCHNHSRWWSGIGVPDNPRCEDAVRNAGAGTEYQRENMDEFQNIQHFVSLNGFGA